MKWKRALTAEEAALVAIGLEQFSSIDEARPLIRQMYDYPPPTGPIQTQAQRASDAAEIEAEQENIKRQALITEALQILGALRDEITIAYSSRFQKNLTEVTTSIVIANWQIDDQYDCVDTEFTTITKSSLADWFYERDHKKIALLFDESILVRLTALENPSPQKKTITEQKLKVSDKEITKIEARISKLEEQTIELKSLAMMPNTKKMNAMILAQNKFWHNYDPKKLPTQQSISNYIAELLGKEIKDRVTDELTRAILPDNIKRK